jgi:hypothetical protein
VNDDAFQGRNRFVEPVSKGGMGFFLGEQSMTFIGTPEDHFGVGD